MDLVAQAKVLRALQSGEISPRRQRARDPRRRARPRGDQQGPRARPSRTGASARTSSSASTCSRSAARACASASRTSRSSRTRSCSGFAKENGTKPKPIDDAVFQALVARQLAGQRARAEERRRAHGDPLRRSRHDRRPARGPAREPVRRGGGRARRRRRTRASTTSASEQRRATRAPVPGQYLTLREFREQTERKYIVDTLKLTGWNISRTAVVLGVERTNLHKKIRGYRIKRGEG